MKTRKLTNKRGREFYKTAHTLKNSDMIALFEFFNPEKNQVQISGSSVINGDRVPNFLQSLGYEVSWGNKSWHVKIPEEYRMKVITEEKIIKW